VEGFQAGANLPEQLPALPLFSPKALNVLTPRGITSAVAREQGETRFQRVLIQVPSPPTLVQEPLQLVQDFRYRTLATPESIGHPAGLDHGLVSNPETALESLV
jgi:hypothetical protein